MMGKNTLTLQKAKLNISLIFDKHKYFKEHNVRLVLEYKKSAVYRAAQHLRSLYSAGTQ